MSFINLLTSFLIILSIIACISAQNNFVFTDGFLQPPPASNFLPPQPQNKIVFPHRAVLQASQDESRLPPNLINPFYKNPRLRQELARHSLLGPGEEPVYERQADRISRKEIYTVLNHAGFVRTNRL